MQRFKEYTSKNYHGAPHFGPSDLSVIPQSRRSLEETQRTNIFRFIDAQSKSSRLIFRGPYIQSLNAFSKANIQLHTLKTRVNVLKQSINAI